jgi:hypothetical protein
MKERKFHTKSTTERRIEGKERIQTIRRAERVRRQARY